MDKELGKVASVFFGREDHGILTAMIQIDFGGSSQGFGGLALNGRTGGDFYLALLDLFAVDTLQKAVGQPVYALRNGFGGAIVGLETPAFNGGRRFLIEEWRKRVFAEVSP